MRSINFLFLVCGFGLMVGTVHSAQLVPLNAKLLLTPVAGYVVQNDVLVFPGVKPPVARIRPIKAKGCIQGDTEIDALCAEILENNSEGKVYLFYDTNRSWRISTDLGRPATSLEGNIDPTGAFMMAGVHELSGSHVFLVGKAKLRKGTLQPVSLTGTLYFTSPDTLQEFGVVNFRSNGTFE